MASSVSQTNQVEEVLPQECEAKTIAHSSKVVSEALKANQSDSNTFLIV